MPADDDSGTLDSSASQEKKLSVLEQFGYQIQSVIGKGTYAKVKLATSKEHNNNTVAIKIIPKHKVPKDFLEKFLPREMEIAKLIKHPHLILFYQSLETTQKCYLVMEYASRGSLLDMIKKEERLVEYYCRLYLQQLLDGLQYLHNLGIVHRDIKCENLLFDVEYNLKLTDFGFARTNMLPEKGEDPIMSQTYCGSLAYASPEVLNGVPYDPFYSDIWATGIILYAMVFGYLPFNDNNLAKLIRQTQSKLIFPHQIEASPEVKKLIPKILAPLKVRYKIVDILNDEWTLKEEEPPQRVQSGSQIDEDEDEE